MDQSNTEPENTGEATEKTDGEQVVEAPATNENDMASLLAASDGQFRQLKYGDVIEGTVMHKDPDGILVDIGFKSEGIIPNHELQSLTGAEMAALSVGDEVLVSVLQPEDKEGHVVLSLDKARQEKSWRKLQKQYEGSEIIEAEVTGYNKGGLLVNLEGVRGFVPASQVTGLSTGGNEASKQSELARFTGQKLSLKIIEINRNRNRLILSERQAAQEQRDARKEQLLSELSPGQNREGHVSSICDFGAFVDIGGADGLIHLSELSWSRVNHPSEVLRVGQPVTVYVMSVDERDRKIALSLKRTQPEPWSQVMDRYHIGQLVRGTITQLTDFGAFARLEDGIEGLIHVSELAEGRVTHPRNIVQEGWELTLRVIRIDPQRRRMGLSLKRAMRAEEGDTLEPQGELPTPTPQEAGAKGTKGGRGGRGGRDRQDEQGLGSMPNGDEEGGETVTGSDSVNNIEASSEMGDEAEASSEMGGYSQEVVGDEAGDTGRDEAPAEMGDEAEVSNEMGGYSQEVVGDDAGDTGRDEAPAEMGGYSQDAVGDAGSDTGRDEAPAEMGGYSQDAVGDAGSDTGRDEAPAEMGGYSQDAVGDAGSDTGGDEATTTGEEAADMDGSAYTDDAVMGGSDAVADEDSMAGTANMDEAESMGGEAAGDSAEDMGGTAADMPSQEQPAGEDAEPGEGNDTGTAT